MASVSAMTSNLALAQRVVAEVNTEIRSSHQLIDRIRDLPFIPSVGDPIEQRVSATVSWKAMIQFAHHHKMRDEAHAAVTVASMAYAARHSLKSIQEGTINLAIGKFEKGDCGEMTHLALVKTTQFLPALVVKTGNTPEESDSKINHGFLILPPSLRECEDVFKGIGPFLDSRPSWRIMEWIQTLPSGTVLLDPFLRVACLTSDLFSGKSDFTEYNAVWGIQYVWDVTAFGQKSPKIAEMEQVASAVYEDAKRVISKMEIVSFGASFLSRIFQEACDILIKTFPETKWKCSQKTGLQIFFQGPKEKTEAISDKLSRHRIEHRNSKIQKSDAYCILLTDPDMSKLRALSI